MNRTQLKYIAITAMLLDHIGMLFGGFFMHTTWGPALYFVLRFLGRLTAPIMCFFLTEGYIFSHSRKNYALRLLIFAIVSQVPYALAHNNSLLTLDFNMLFMLLISLAVLRVLESGIKEYFKFFLVLVLMGFICYCDWGFFGPLMVICFYVFREKPLKLVLFYCLIVLGINVLSCFFLPVKGIEWYSELWQLGLFLFIPVLYVYNGEGGQKNAFNKWFFYIFYPLHLLILWAIKLAIQ